MSIRDISYIGEGLVPAPLDGNAHRYTPLPKADVTDVVLHHWTGWLPPETWTADEEIAYIVRIDQYHRAGRGLDAIGYQVCPFPSGRIYIVSRLDRYGAHVGYENNHLIGIGLPGSFRSHLPSARHLAATVEAVRYVYDYLGRDVPTRPHLYWGGTTCPGERWREWVPQLRDRVLTPEEDDMEPELGKVSPPSATGLKRLPGEFAGKWPAWNIGGFIRYGFKLLRQRDDRIAALVLRVKALEQLKNPCNFGTDHATMGERMSQYRAAIKTLQEAVAALEASGGSTYSDTDAVKAVKEKLS